MTDPKPTEAIVAKPADAAPAAVPCPSCGRCPTCGKGAFASPYYPYFQYIPAPQLHASYGLCWCGVYHAYTTSWGALTATTTANAVGGTTWEARFS